MARLVLTSSGSSGDVNPLVALGLGLHARGHDVVFVLEERLCATVRRLGFETHAMGGNLDEFFRAHVATILQAPFPETAAIANRLYVRHYLLPNFTSQAQAVGEACRGADAVIAPWLHHAAVAAAELAAAPWLTLLYSPLIIPSAHMMAYPPFHQLPRPLWTAANRFTWTLGKRMFGPMVDRPVNMMRTALGLEPRKYLSHEGSLSPEFTALALPRSLMAPLPDWPPQVRITGYCFWDTPANWRPTAELDAFLRGADPIVVIYFGSMAGKAFAPLYRTAVQAVLNNGARALAIGVTPEVVAIHDCRVLTLPFAPFSTVFARCAAVVHHGGIGTAGRVLQAGLPMLVIPWGYDQFAGAMMMVNSGAARTVPARRASVHRVTTALGAVLEDARHRAAAHALAGALASEDGVETLAAAIEQHLACGASH